MNVHRKNVKNSQMKFGKEDAHRHPSPPEEGTRMR